MMHSYNKCRLTTTTTKFL